MLEVLCQKGFVRAIKIFFKEMKYEDYFREIDSNRLEKFVNNFKLNLEKLVPFSLFEIIATILIDLQKSKNDKFDEIS